jgi:hypothetical protein
MAEMKSLVSEQLYCQDRQLIIAKSREPQVVAYTCFHGLLNVPSRIWMVRDWAGAKGYHLVGPPQCVFLADGVEPAQQVCEVQWGIDGPVHSQDGEVGLKWTDFEFVVATYHLGAPSGIPATAHRLSVWAPAQGYQLTGPMREVYHFDWKSPPTCWVTEIQLQVERLL